MLKEKKSLSLIVIVFLIICLFSPYMFAEETTRPHSVEIIDNYFRAWATRDMDQIKKYYAENISVYDLPSDQTISGKQQVISFEQETWLANVANMIWVRSSYPIVSENSLSYEWVYSGTYNGKWGKQAINNKPFSIKGISTTKLNQEGKIIVHKDFYDLSSFQSQLGL